MSSPVAWHETCADPGNPTRKEARPASVSELASESVSESDSASEGVGFGFGLERAAPPAPAPHPARCIHPFRSRYSEGVTPATFRKARLKLAASA